MGPMVQESMKHQNSQRSYVLGCTHAVVSPMMHADHELNRFAPQRTTYCKHVQSLPEGAAPPIGYGLSLLAKILKITSNC